MTSSSPIKISFGTQAFLLGFQQFLGPILCKHLWFCELDLSGSGQGPVVGSCEHDNEP
jgi:hypothetical protein